MLSKFVQISIFKISFKTLLLLIYLGLKEFKNDVDDGSDVENDVVFKNDGSDVENDVVCKNDVDDGIDVENDVEFKNDVDDGSDVDNNVVFKNDVDDGSDVDNDLDVKIDSEVWTVDDEIDERKGTLKNGNFLNVAEVVKLLENQNLNVRLVEGPQTSACVQHTNT